MSSRGFFFIICNIKPGGILVYFYSINLCRQFFRFSKKGPRPKWTIDKYVSDNFKKCLYVGNSGIMSVVCRRRIKIQGPIKINFNIA